MAIRDQSYSRYDGPIDDRAFWWVIGFNGLKTYWGFWRVKLTLFLVWLVPVVFSMLVIAEAALGNAPEAGGELGHAGLGIFLMFQFFGLSLVYIARGCGIISDDLRNRTLRLHFSKPISKLDYVAGKMATLVLLGAIAVIVPAVLVAGLRTAFFAQTDVLGPAVVQHLQGLGLLVVFVVLASSLVMAISSLTRRTGYAVLMWIAVLVVPLIIQGIVAIATEGSPWARMLSLNGITGLAFESMAAPDMMPDEIPSAVPFAGIAALIASALSTVWWRLSSLEKLP